MNEFIIEDKNSNMLSVNKRLKTSVIEIQIDNYEEYEYGCIIISKQQAHQLIEHLQSVFGKPE